MSEIIYIQTCPQIIAIKFLEYTIIKFWHNCCDLNSINCKKLHKEITPQQQKKLMDLFGGLLVSRIADEDIFWFSKLGGIIKVRNDVSENVIKTIKEVMI